MASEARTPSLMLAPTLARDGPMQLYAVVNASCMLHSQGQHICYPVVSGPYCSRIRSGSTSWQSGNGPGWGMSPQAWLQQKEEDTRHKARLLHAHDGGNVGLEPHAIADELRQLLVYQCFMLLERLPRRCRSANAQAHLAAWCLFPHFNSAGKHGQGLSHMAALTAGTLAYLQACSPCAAAS